MSLKLLVEQLLGSCPQEMIRREVDKSCGLDSKGLFVPGELQHQKLALRTRAVVYASPNNPGALAVARDLASAMDGEIEVVQDAELMAASIADGGFDTDEQRTRNARDQQPTATHFLLYLNDQTYLNAEGDRLAEELRRARAAGSKIEIVMVHENDQERGGCEFGIFFDGRTPQDLKDGGVYNVRPLPSPSLIQRKPYTSSTPYAPLTSQALAVALYSKQFWPVSVALVAKALGATVANSRLRSGVRAGSVQVQGSSARGGSFKTTGALRTGATERSGGQQHSACAGASTGQGGAQAGAAQAGVDAQTISEEEEVASVPEQDLDALFAQLEQAARESNAEEVLSCRSAIRGLLGGGGAPSPSLPAPREPGDALGTEAEANLNRTQPLIVRTLRTHGESPNAAVDESEAAVHAASAPYRQGRPPAVTPLQPSSQGKLREEEVEEIPKDKKGRLKSRKESMTAGDESYEDASGTKDGPGRSSNRFSSPCSASNTRGSNCGASTSSSKDYNEPIRV